MGNAGAGKGQVAEFLHYHHGFTRMKFASGLKDMLRALGLTEREIEGDLKEVPCGLLCGKTPRHAMITLGTEWGRNQIGDDLWVVVMAEKILKSDADRIVIDDVRFWNEHNVLKSLGAEVWLVRRPGFGPRFDHPSETEHMAICPDKTIYNDGTLNELFYQVNKAV